MTKTAAFENRGRLRRLARLRDRARFLLPMEYTPGELAAALGVSIQTIRRAYNRFGLAHRRTPSGRVFIAGPVFAAWLDSEWQAVEQDRASRQLKPGQAWCFRCNAPRAVQRGHVENAADMGNRPILRGVCPVCGTELNRLTQPVRPVFHEGETP